MYDLPSEANHGGQFNLTEDYARAMLEGGGGFEYLKAA